MKKASSRLVAKALNVVDVSAKKRFQCQAETEKTRINLLIEKFEFSFFFSSAWQWFEFWQASHGQLGWLAFLFLPRSSWPKTKSYPWTLWLASDKQYMGDSLSEAFLGFKQEWD